MRMADLPPAGIESRFPSERKKIYVMIDDLWGSRTHDRGNKGPTLVRDVKVHHLQEHDIGEISQELHNEIWQRLQEDWWERHTVEIPGGWTTDDQQIQEGLKRLKVFCGGRSGGWCYMQVDEQDFVLENWLEWLDVTPSDNIFDRDSWADFAENYIQIPDNIAELADDELLRLIQETAETAFDEMYPVFRAIIFMGIECQDSIAGIQCEWDYQMEWHIHNELWMDAPALEYVEGSCGYTPESIERLVAFYKEHHDVPEPTEVVATIASIADIPSLEAIEVALQERKGVLVGTTPTEGC